jgi:hypothetical protein
MSRNGMRTVRALVALAAGCGEPTTDTSATGSTAAVCKAVAQKVMDASLIAHLGPRRVWRGPAEGLRSPLTSGG